MFFCAKIIGCLALLAPSALGATAVLRGRVGDASGNPLASATINVFRVGSSAVFAELESGEDGRFEAPDLPDAEYRLEISKPGYVPVSWLLPSLKITALVRMARCGAISGTVFDSQGSPISGARVVLLVRAPGTGLLRHVKAGGESPQTGEDGHYRLLGIPPGEYSVAVILGERATDTQPGSSGFQLYPDNSEPRTFAVSQGEEYTGIDFSVPRGNALHISGNVELPVPGARAALSLVRSDQSALAMAAQISDDDGNFNFELMGLTPGDYELLPEPRNRQTEQYLRHAPSSAQEKRQQQLFRPQSGINLAQVPRQ